MRFSTPLLFPPPPWRPLMILAICFRVPELNPFLANRASGCLKIANRRFEAIRANRSHVMRIGGFLRIDSCESIRANRPGHLRSTVCILGAL